MFRFSDRAPRLRWPRAIAASLVAVASLLISSSPASGADSARQLSDAGPMTELKAMLLKYVARCALNPSQHLSAGPTAPATQFPGSLGLAPEWLSGTCSSDCQERVSACLISLVNRTGKHVDLSMTSAAPSMLARLAPNANDLDYPHQEGAFFGNVWKDQTFTCQGTGVRKAPQSKRFCASQPATCSAGGAPIVDVGACANACEMKCFSIGPGAEDQRCAAVSCRDPGGHVWPHPITILLKGQLAAANADRVSAMDIAEDGLIPRAASASATFDLVDFGPTPGAITRMRVGLGGSMPGARIEAWLGESQRIGTAVVKAGAPEPSRIEIPLSAAKLAGPNPVVLRVHDGRRTGKITNIELR